ncbi:TPA: DUF551 domain-containing protein [Klebsiella pneumoniae]|uniref:DUF551 domain-containing protein n=1 Tax=Klebsiella pneumoniae TaxID=573 RepID=UPI001E5F0A48|nr:DUF551 domain-containing protein [Klebsiella pneumoniae]HBU6024763.1 DUF551 domain-containing protein [Klebsiella pneumoniae]
MTSKLTRERLQEIAEDGFLKHGESKELARMALAAMDSEPDCKERKLFCSTDTTRMRKTISVSAGTEDAPLYRHAQPAPVVPVVPDEIKHRIGGLDWGWEGEFNRGWNACRAAMLAAAPQSPGSEPATVPGKWIPVSERMPEDEQEVLTINRMGHRFVSFFDKHSGLFFDRLDAPAACCIEHVLVTHWMPLPAAPQEVKGE